MIVQEMSVELNMDQGTFKVIARKDVVEEVFDDRDEVDLSTALVKNPAYEIGDIYEEDVTPKDFGRVGAQEQRNSGNPNIFVMLNVKFYLKNL